MDEKTQGFVTHRCSARPIGMSLRKAEGSDLWVLGQHRSDWEWDYEWLDSVCTVKFCPWCGEELD